MRRSQATRYARWSALTALGIVVIVAGVYARRAWQLGHALKKAPLPLPVSVTQRSATFAFSKVEGDRTLFTVRASHATEFKEGNKHLLEDVWITVYGRTGARFDNLHTQQCDYLHDAGRVVCKGEVQIDLESVEEAKQPAAQRGFRVVTSDLSFDRQTGEARSEQPVTFRFPYGQGSAVGVSYSSNEAAVRLLRDVQLKLTQTGAGNKAEPIQLTGGSMEYRREAHVLRLLGPVHVQQGAREINAGQATVELSPDLRARRMVASGRPELVSRDPEGTSVLSADTARLDISADGEPAHLRAEGHLKGGRKRPANSGDQQFESDRLDMDFDPSTGNARRAMAEGNVIVETNAGKLTERTSRLTTSTLLIDFSAGHGGRTDLARAESTATTTIELRSLNDASALHFRHLTADYGPGSVLRQLRGSDGVEIERRLPNQSAQFSSSDAVDVDFDAGRWTEARQSGNVRLREGERTAHADRARMVRAADTMILSGSAAIGDAQSETAAPTIILNQRTGEISCEGGVRTTYRKAEVVGITNLAQQPAHITAQRLVARRASGAALYSGRARLWQGDAVIEGETLELRRDERVLLARGGVSALLPQSAAPSAAQPTRNGAAANAAAAPQRVLWLARAARLTYRSAEGLALLEDNVHAESSLARIDSRVLKLFLSSAEGTAPGSGGLGAANGARQLTRALATGGVTVRQEDRRGTAEQAEYLVADGKFVLSGGNPTLYDAVEGTTTGRQLTFFLADDRILVESSEGTRTLTRHRIQK
jgi:lipopolysaccharide export system protein LptA